MSGFESRRDLGDHGRCRGAADVFLAALITILTLAGVVAAQAPVLDAKALGGGGGSVSDGTHRLDATLGQVGPGLVANGGHRAGIGFWYLVDVAVTTSIGGDELPLVRTGLEQNSPNPFNPLTTIRYSVGTAGPVSLTMYDLQGRVVARLVDRHQEVGAYEMMFQPRGLASGTYVYRLVTSDGMMNRRMVLLK